MIAVPDGHDQRTELEVFNFTGAGGVALSMYNTDEVNIKQMCCFFFLHSSFFHSSLEAYNYCPSA